MKRILIVFIFIFLNSCDYKPIYSTVNSKFKINDIEITGNKKVNKLMLRQISKLKNNTSGLIYDLEIFTSRQINSISKDEKGNTKILEMIISSDINLKKNNSTIKKYSFSENFTYDNNSNKFELSQYEKNIEYEIVTKIVQNLILAIGTL
tara:strand:- start:7802 stop:8251 length:450 start_codon:yes stop_codon:yes gene_type:complete